MQFCSYIYTLWWSTHRQFYLRSLLQLEKVILLTTFSKSIVGKSLIKLLTVFLEHYWKRFLQLVFLSVNVGRDKYVPVLFRISENEWARYFERSWSFFVTFLAIKIRMILLHNGQALQLFAMISFKVSEQFI